MYGKATETAIAALSRLAETYDGGATKISATDIAEARGLQRPYVAKVLTVLAQAGLVEGSRGPGGGFTMSRAPKDIPLYDVYCLFEREDGDTRCPFGGGICGVGEGCGLHDKLVDVQTAIDTVLHDTTFEVFTTTGRKSKPRSGSDRDVSPPRGRQRESFRAAPSSKKKRKR